MADKTVKKLTLGQEEILAYEVKFYPCLFDKAEKGYKERDYTANAWEEVANSIAFIENGKYGTYEVRFIG